uniref:Uncharacterized protein n=1 Tax=Clytia hemisphaerica TaxID=252671 RepID=A0A7M6DNG6_9CNID
SKLSHCCLYEGQQVTASLNNTVFVEDARSTVECILRCQRLEKTPLYTEEKKCYCFGKFEEQSSNESKTGTIFKKVSIVGDEMEDKTVNYNLIGTLEMICTSDTGRMCEYHGSFVLNIGSLPVNQNITIWSVPQLSFLSIIVGNVHTVQINHQFKEKKSFTTSELELITFDGAIQEYDFETKTSNVLGDFNGQSFIAKDIFQADGRKIINGDTGYATITLQFVKT